MLIVYDRECLVITPSNVTRTCSRPTVLPVRNTGYVTAKEVEQAYEIDAKVTSPPKSPGS